MILLCFLFSQLCLSQTTPGFKSQIIRDNDFRVVGEYRKYHAYTRFSKDANITKFSTNGNHWGDHYLVRAFDGNHNLFWESNILNSNRFKAYLEVEFSKPVTVDRISFATRRDGANRGGFPNTATFYIASNLSTGLTKIGSVDTPLSDYPILYTFNQSYTFQKFRFEFTVVNPHKYQLASCAFMYFLKPEGKKSVEAFNLFSDYCMLTLKDQYKSMDSILALNESVKNLPYYNQNLKFYIDRAVKVINGELKYDPRREFSTDPSTKGLLLPQVGSTREYCYNVLKMVWLGTERIPTGITVVPNEPLNYFVDAEDNDPIPRIRFTQHMGHWKKWITGNYILYKGFNSFRCPNLFNNWYKNTLPGGPIYIANPFEEGSQSKKVRVYIEGGSLFPVFRSGDNETKFLEYLKQYNKEQSQNRNSMQNLMELVTDNVFITVRSSLANYYFNQRSSEFSPQKTADNLQRYVRTLYTYEGVKYDKKHPYYKRINEYLNVNIRIMQDYAAAYAFTEHVGIQIGGWEEIILQARNFGWGHSHEIGHMLDLMPRIYSETTNNMLANYRRVMHEGQSSRPDNGKFTWIMTQDEVIQRYTWQWMDQIGKIVTWWNIEAIFPDFWGNMNNYYRYNSTDGINNVNELMVYYSSLVTGINLSYYYDRLGLWMGGNNMFSYKSSSKKFKDMMNLRASQGRIKENPLKFWYLDRDAYYLLRKNNQNMKAYTEEDQPASPVVKISLQNKYIIKLPDPPKFHLCYEVYQGNETNGYNLIGFTYGKTFTDSKTYPSGYIPNYKFIAYDRTLSHTKLSQASGKVIKSARINNVEYNTLTEALNNAKDNDTIYLLDDINEYPLNMPNADIEIRVDPSIHRNITIGKRENYDTIKGSYGRELKIIGRPDAGIVFEGYNTGFSSGAGIYYPSGNLYLEYVYFQNINSIRYSGAAIAIGDSKYNLTIKNCGFYNNQAHISGSAIYASEAIGSTTFIENTSFIQNYVQLVSSAYSAGALKVLSPNGITINNCLFKNNHAFDGGVMYTNKATTVSNSLFIDNFAKNRGGVVLTESLVTFENCSFERNMGGEGGIAYTIQSGHTIFNDCNILNSTATGKGGVLFSNIKYDKIQNSRIVFRNTNISGGSAPQGSFIYAYSGVIDINSSDNTINGAISIDKSYPVHINYYGSLSNTLLQLESDKAKNSKLINFYDPLPDDFLSHFIVPKSYRSKYVLSASKDNNALIIAPVSFIIRYKIKNVDYPINGAKFDQEFQLSIPDDVDNNIAVTGFYYNGKLYDIYDKINVTTSGYIIGRYKYGGYNLRVNVNGKILISKEELKKGDFFQSLTFGLDDDLEVVGFIYNNKTYKIGEKIKFDGKNINIHAIVKEKEDPTFDSDPSHTNNETDVGINDNSVSQNISKHNSKKLIIIVLSVLSVAFVAGVVGATVFIIKKRNQREREMEEESQSSIIVM